MENYLWMVRQYGIPSNDLSGWVHIEQSTAMYYSGIGEYEKAREKFMFAIEKARELGDGRLYEESTLFLSIGHTLRGELKSGQELLEEALDSSLRRGDAQIRALAWTCQARNHSVLRDIDALERDVQEIEVTFRNKTASTKDACTRTAYNAFSALSALERNNLSTALRFAAITESLLKDSEPTAFFAFDAFHCVCEVYLAEFAQLEPNARENGSKWRKIKAQLKAVLTKWENFAHYFPITRPRFYLYKGLFAFHLGQQQKALKFFQTSQEEAQRLRHSFDEALALFCISQLDCEELSKRERKTMRDQAKQLAVPLGDLFELLPLGVRRAFLQ